VQWLLVVLLFVGWVIWNNKPLSINRLIEKNNGKNSWSRFENSFPQIFPCLSQKHDILWRQCQVCLERPYGKNFRQVASKSGRSHFFRLRLRSCSKKFESRSGFGNFQISESGYHRSNRNLSMFFLKKWPHRLLLLPKLKSDSGSGSVFLQNFDIRVRKENAESCWRRLRNSVSMATAGGLHIDTVGSSRQCLLKIPVFFPFKKYKILFFNSSAFGCFMLIQLYIFIWCCK